MKIPAHVPASSGFHHPIPDQTFAARHFVDSRQMIGSHQYEVHPYVNKDKAGSSIVSTSESERRNMLKSITLRSWLPARSIVVTLRKMQLYTSKAASQRPKLPATLRLANGKQIITSSSQPTRRAGNRLMRNAKVPDSKLRLPRRR